MLPSSPHVRAVYLGEAGVLSGEVRDVVIVPIGFLSDHIEILFDLDTEAQQLCEQLELNMVRAQTVGSQPSVIQTVHAGDDALKFLLQPIVGTDIKIAAQQGIDGTVEGSMCCQRRSRHSANRSCIRYPQMMARINHGSPR